MWPLATLTGFSYKKMFKRFVAVLAGWPYGGIPLYIFRKIKREDANDQIDNVRLKNHPHYSFSNFLFSLFWQYYCNSLFFRTFMNFSWPVNFSVNGCCMPSQSPTSLYPSSTNITVTLNDI